MIYVGIGANLHHADYGSPQNTCGAALYSLNEENIHISACSRWYESAPVPVSDQPNYINAVISVETTIKPLELLNLLLKHEEEFGRTHNNKNAARTLDLDLLDYHGEIIETTMALNLPHPRLHERAFVLLPLAELDPNWQHPQTGSQINDLIEKIPNDLKAIPLDPLPGEYGTAWTPALA